MLEIREDQLEALRQSVRAQFPATVLRALKGRGLDAERDKATGTVVARDEKGHATSLSFKPDGAPDTLRLPSGEHYALETDGAGRVIAVDHSGGARLEIGHDDAGRVTKLLRPGVDEHGFSYDDNGHLSTVVYPDGAAEKFDLDPAGNLIGYADRSGARTAYARDGSGNLRAVRDPLGRETQFQYADGALDRIVFPDGSEQSFEYDAEENAGLVTRRDGTAVYKQLNSDGALTGIVWPDGSFVDFDLANGSLLGAYSDTGWVSFELDANGNAAKEKSADGVALLDYDSDGRLERLVTPHGDTIQYGYDGDGRLTSIVDWDGLTQRFKYGDDGTVRAIRYGNGLVEQQGYGATGRLESARVTNDRKRVLSEQRYGYDVCGQLTDIEDLDPKEGWRRRLSLDAEGRITSLIDGSGHVVNRLEYDAKGNIVRDGDSDVVIGPLDQIVRHGEDDLEYDGIGNVTRMPGPNGGVLEHSYNANGSMRETRVGERTIHYEYDPLGRRVLKTDGVATWRYGYVNNQLLWEEYQEAPGVKAVRRDYLWCPDSVVPVAFREGGRTYWIQCDMRGAPVRVFKRDGATVWRARYDAFGRAQIEIEHVRMPLRLAGQYHDAETGLHYSLCRYYCPRLKTYLARDPFWQRVSATNYSYARNRPYEYADPFGSLAFILGALAAVAVGAVVGAVVAGVTAAATGQPILGAVAAGAVEGAATVVGAVVGGLLGGPVGMVAGAMAGGAVGTFGGALVEQAVNGDPVCFKCAAKAAAMALAIDVALLGLGKIPGVKRVVRALGDKLKTKGDAIKGWVRRKIRRVPKVPGATPQQQYDLEEVIPKARKMKKEIDATADQIADEIPGATVAKAPLKKPETIVEKSGRKYKTDAKPEGDVTALKDVARNTIVTPPGQEKQALKRLRELNPDIKDSQVKIVEGDKDPLGYSGMNIEVPTKHGHAETQINSPQMIYGKEKPKDARAILGDDVYDDLANRPGMPEGGKGHTYYEDYRVSKDPVHKAKVAEESKAYYDAVRDIGGS